MRDKGEEIKERTDIPREEMYREWAKENPDLLVKEAIGQFRQHRDLLNEHVDKQCRLSKVLAGSDDVLSWDEIIERVKKMSA